MTAPATTSRPADVLLPRLEGVKAAGPGRWLARCPAHEDRRPSLSVREGDDGRVLLHCFAGCSTADVLAAVGLTVADLFERPTDHRAGKPRIAKPSGAEIMTLLGQAAVALEVALAVLADGGMLTPDDMAHVRQHIARIHAVRQVFANG